MILRVLAAVVVLSCQSEGFSGPPAEQTSQVLHQAEHARRNFLASAAVLLLPTQTLAVQDQWPDSATHPLPMPSTTTANEAPSDVQQAIEAAQKKKAVGPRTHG